MPVAELGYLRGRTARTSFVVVRGAENTPYVTIPSLALRWRVSCSWRVADSFPRKGPEMAPISTKMASARLNQGT